LPQSTNIVVRVSRWCVIARPPVLTPPRRYRRSLDFWPGRNQAVCADCTSSGSWSNWAHARGFAPGLVVPEREATGSFRDPARGPLCTKGTGLWVSAAGSLPVHDPEDGAAVQCASSGQRTTPWPSSRSHRRRQPPLYRTSHSHSHSPVGIRSYIPGLQPLTGCFVQHDWVLPVHLPALGDPGTAKRFRRLDQLCNQRGAEAAILATVRPLGPVRSCVGLGVVRGVQLGPWAAGSGGR
jgi:hypothetical protein